MNKRRTIPQTEPLATVNHDIDIDDRQYNIKRTKLSGKTTMNPSQFSSKIYTGISRRLFEMLFFFLALSFAGLATLSTTAAYAGEADVVGGSITALGDGRYRIDATVRHADVGWDHYADRWDVVGPDGTILGVRELAHPHENEQPFTRSLTLEIPAGIATVTLQANDSVHGLGGETFELTVPAS